MERLASKVASLPCLIYRLPLPRTSPKVLRLILYSKRQKAEGRKQNLAA